MKRVMRKPFSDYRALILDLDGTLYVQPHVQMYMGLRLILYYALHHRRLNELRALKAYRELREADAFAGEEDFERLQLQSLARRYHMEENDVERVIQQWMFLKPLKAIHFFRRKNLLRLVQDRMARGVKVIVYSDYPVHEKLAALGLTPDAAYCAHDPQIRCMKPNPAGLTAICALNHLSVSDTLYIGDRFEKDGLCAERVGMDYCILYFETWGLGAGRKPCIAK